MRFREFIRESTKPASAEQVWDYVDRIHPVDQQGGGFLKKLILRNPQYELKRVPLSSIHIPDQEYDDEEQGSESDDPYNRAMFVDPAYAGEYSQHHVNQNPIVVDANGYILDGNHRAWAAANLLNKSDIMAWVPVKDLNEIARLPKSDAGDFGDKGTIVAPKYAVKKKPLPGGSKFTYAVNNTGQGDIEIMIFDGRTLAAEMDLFDTQDFMKTWRVDTVVVDPDYRGQGLGKALYGIALSILKLTLEAGETQTRHGQQMWLMLNSIPGVEVVGYNMEPTDEYQHKPGDKIIDQNKMWTRYTFPVKPGSTSMRSGRRGTGIYTSQASMLARWIGR